MLGRYILPAKVLDLLETTDAGVFDCGYKQGFLRQNLAVSMRDTELTSIIRALFKSIMLAAEN